MGIMLIILLSGLILFLLLGNDKIIQVKSFCVSVLAGGIVSFSFLIVLLYFLRPKFDISPFICFENGFYRFKVVNKSIYHAFDISVELFIMTPHPHTDGKSNLNMKTVKLGISKMTSINRYRKKSSEKDPYSLFAVTLMSTDDLMSELVKKDTFLEFRLTVRHGLTGLADRFVMKFPNEGIIKEKHKFCYGERLDTIPINHS